MRNASQTTEALEMIRAMGVGIALDDFGTGYSSLGYLGRLPIDTIKIDQRFIRELPADQESIAIVTAVLSLSSALGKSVVAEGIETPRPGRSPARCGLRDRSGLLFRPPHDQARPSPRWRANRESRRSHRASFYSSPLGIGRPFCDVSRRPQKSSPAKAGPHHSRFETKRSRSQRHLAVSWIEGRPNTVAPASFLLFYLQL